MTNKTIPAGTVIYESMKDDVASLDVVVKGVVRASGDYCTIELLPGSVIGIGEMPGEKYIFTYEASEEATICSYPYESEASLVALFKGNPKILSALIAGSVRFAMNMQSAVLDTLEFARTEYAGLREALGEYPAIAKKAGITPRSFEELEAFGAPDMKDKARGWHRDFVEDLCANEAVFKKEMYPIPSIGLGIGLQVNTYALESRDFMADVMAYVNALSYVAKDFKNHLSVTKEQAANMESGGDKIDTAKLDASVIDCLNTIKRFANPDPKVFDAFTSTLSAFMANPDRYGTDDETRKLRRDLSATFYDIYLSVFLKAYNVRWELVPLGIKMFLLFGYVDGNLAGGENTRKLADIASNIKIGTDSRVITMYEWLRMVYEGKVVPSKNELNLDYAEYLREQKKEQRISATEESHLLNNMMERLKYEVKNFFTIGNRITFGRITSFVPVFDKQNAVKSIDVSYLSPEAVNAEINRIREIDFTAFCRQGVFSMPEAGVNSLFTSDEVLPYVILMPNAGNRASMWQEIDSKKHHTPARMIISILHNETIEDTMIGLVGEFRWEMCKTEQGVRWNDVTSPCLTSFYFDYLQFYRKNSKLTPEMREKISTALKNNANNFKKVFISDYQTYIKYEANNALRMNKIARSIMFKFCPFSQKTLEKFKENPQYAPLVIEYDLERKQRLKQLSNITIKIEKNGLKVPEEITKQIELWNY